MFKRRGVFYFLGYFPPFSNTKSNTYPLRTSLPLIFYGEVFRIKRRTTVTTTIAQQSREKPNDTKLIAVSFFEAVSEFLKNCTIRGLAADTIKLYDKELKQVGRSLDAIKSPLSDVRKLRQSDIEGFIAHQLELGRAVSTINTRIRAGRTFFNFCKDRDFIAANPFDGIEQLKQRHEIGATFTKRQLKMLLDAPDVTTFAGLRDLAMMLTLAHTGIRLTELVNLRVQNVSFDEKGAINVQYTKNRYARRIPLTERLKAVLKAYMQERGVLHTDALFITVEDEPVNQRLVQLRIKEYGEKTGVNKEVAVNPHAFRRTFCRLKIEAGTNIFVLQRLTGHQSLEILKRYVQIYGKDLEDAIEQGFENM
nr:tyrosine-type recombinase/integrase [Bacillus mediterraneensis]